MTNVFVDFEVLTISLYVTYSAFIVRQEYAISFLYQSWGNRIVHGILRIVHFGMYSL